MKHTLLTRYAPTPSGYLHLGNIYSFILTYQLAKKNGAEILLRIDDMDSERVKTAYIQDIFDCLDYLELPYHQGPKSLKEFQEGFSQHRRMKEYEVALEVLKQKKRLFACDCSRAKVDRMHPQGYYTGHCRDRGLDFAAKGNSWRFRSEMHQTVPFNDLSGGKIDGRLPGILKDFVVRRKDGLPAYQLTSVVDDIHFGVDMVVRGKDLWGSSVAQVLLSRSLNNNKFAETKFHHHLLLKDPGNKKLSKSSGSTSVYFLRKQGKKKADIFGLIGNMIGKEGIESLEDFGFLVDAYEAYPSKNLSK